VPAAETIISPAYSNFSVPVGVKGVSEIEVCD
jgi:hypothetical protein